MKKSGIWQAGLGAIEKKDSATRNFVKKSAPAIRNSQFSF